MLNRLESAAHAEPTSEQAAQLLAAVQQLNELVASSNSKEINTTVVVTLESESVRQLGTSLTEALEGGPVRVNRDTSMRLPDTLSPSSFGTPTVIQRSIWDTLGTVASRSAATIRALAARIITLFSSLSRNGGDRYDEETGLVHSDEDKEASQDDPRKEPRTHFLPQSDTVLADVGDIVINMGTTSCGLVLAYGVNQKVACYHWPFMSDSPGYHNKFQEIIDELGVKVSFIQVITNDFGSEQSAKEYKKVMRSIKDRYKVATTYYIHPGEVRGIDPHVKLASGGIESFNEVKEVNFTE